MKQEVVWTWAATADLQNIYAVAEDRRAGSGDELLAQVEQATAMLASFPQMAPVWQHPVRRLVIRRSTLGVFYVPEARGIIVLTVADLRQDPDRLWRDIQYRMREE